MDAVFEGACDARSLLPGLREPDGRTSWASIVDLRDMKWSEPAVLVGIACLVEAEVREGRSVRVLAPQRRNVANYLARMRLSSLLSALGAQHDLPAVNSRDATSLLELRLFNGSRGAEQLARLVDPQVRPHDQDAATALWEGICETGQNVEQHSGQRYGFVAAQRYRATVRSPSTRFLFAVGDSGRGMLGTLADRGATDSARAIELALTPGLSEDADPARGSGLPDIDRLLRQIGGGLSVISGDAGRSTHGSSSTAWKAPVSFVGTVLQGEIRR